MTIEENTKDKTVDELAGALADGVGEEKKEPKVDAQELEEQMKAELETADAQDVSEENEAEIAAEEVAEDVVQEDASADASEDGTAEASEEGTTEASEDVTTETIAENVATEETVEETPKKKKFWKIFAIVAASVVVILAGVYVGFSLRYAECFMYGTVVNGTDCSGKTVKEVEKMIQTQIEEYTLIINGAEGYSETIKGSDINIVYQGKGQLDGEFKKQNEFTWPKGLFKKNEITAEMKFEYDSEKLNEKIAGLGCMNPENQVAAVAATVVYKDGQFVIQDETYGTQIDETKFKDAIVVAISGFENTLDIEKQGCYIQPKFTKDSQEVHTACDEMNKYLAANITYSYDGIVLTLDKSQFAGWISVDENMTPVVSEASAKEFAGTVASKYNTANRSGQLTTPFGKTVTMPLGGYGRVVGTDSETKQIIADIKEGKSLTREPIFSRKATPDGQNIWGSTYMEVDITAQHIWFIVNGQVALETDVITGTKGVHDTPTGVFEILEKKKDKVLRGRPGPDGKPIYLQPVSYWMRVTWSGIGFHDADWRNPFGGQEYVIRGSHGCINMPPAKAAELYNMLPMGTPVVIHY